jgi:hypothetical protein
MAVQALALQEGLQSQSSLSEMSVQVIAFGRFRRESNP